MLLGTGALLKVLDPGPLTASASSSLFAIGGDDRQIERIFETTTPVSSGQWNYIYIHQSLTSVGNAQTLGERGGGLADHFVIGNGQGSADGEIQIGRRWTRQQSAGAITRALRPDCISICLVGDFNQDRPTATQLMRLEQLVMALQRKLAISGQHILLISDENSSVAGMGSQFPVARFRAQLQP
jgi:hypothetical protein